MTKALTLLRLFRVFNLPDPSLVVTAGRTSPSAELLDAVSVLGSSDDVVYVEESIESLDIFLSVSLLIEITPRSGSDKMPASPGSSAVLLIFVVVGSVDGIVGAIIDVEAKNFSKSVWPLFVVVAVVTSPGFCEILTLNFCIAEAPDLDSARTYIINVAGYSNFILSKFPLILVI